MNNSAGLFLATKGGYNDESHNHNDVGTFSLWIDQTPVLIDAGVGTYTRQTFSSERYSIWTMQSNYHNLPLINGVPQNHGRKYKATDVKATPNRFEANIATAYPPAAKAKYWIRSYQLKGKALQINDAFELEETLSPNVINFMTWGEVDASAPGKVRIRLENVQAELTYNPRLFHLTVEPIELTDPRLSNVWGKQIFRLSFQTKQKTTKGTYTFTIKRL